MALIYNILYLLVFHLLVIHSITAQSFSGKITYRIHYENRVGGDRSEFLHRTAGNYHVFYTDGCNQRTDYLYEDQILWTVLYHCDSRQSFLLYPEVERVLQHDMHTLDRKTEIVSYEKNVMDILGVACDRLIVDYACLNKEGRVEYFFSSQYHLDDEVALVDNRLALEEHPLASAIPLAVVGGNTNAYQAAEAITIEPIYSQHI